MDEKVNKFRIINFIVLCFYYMIIISFKYENKDFFSKLTSSDRLPLFEKDIRKDSFQYILRVNLQQFDNISRWVKEISF